MSVINNSIIAGAAGSGGAAGYTIDNSLKINSPDSPNLKRAITTTGDRQKFTLSLWLKRTLARPAADTKMFFAINSTGQPWMYFYNKKFEINIDNSIGAWVTEARFIDPSAWYHIVVSVDTTNATPADRLILWVNGVRQTFSASPTITQNLLTNANLSGTEIRLGSYGAYLYDGYMAETYWIDGQALTATDFGEFDADTGVWNPIEYTGTYGTNGFYLPFNDNSSVSALGTDASPNGNNFTVTSIALTEGNGNWISQVQATNYSSSYGVPQMFDDNPSSECLLQQSSNLTWNIPGGLAFTTSFEVEAYDTGTGEITFNWSGGSYTYSLPNSSAGLVDISANLTSPITSITWSQGADIQGPYVRQWVIDGVRLVDNSFGKDNDCLKDSPTNGNNTLDTGLGGELSGNYCTMSRLIVPNNDTNGLTGWTFSEGNLRVARTGGVVRTVLGTHGMQSGKWYWESTLTGSESYNFIGIGHPNIGTSIYLGATTGTYGIQIASGSISMYPSSGATLITSSGWDEGKTFGVGFDADNNRVNYYLDGVLAAYHTGVSTDYVYHPGVTFYSGSANSIWDMNFGQRKFAYQAPAGYKCLCTANYPDPDIADGSTAMDVRLYDGTSNTQSISGFNFSPDLVWTKNRGASASHPIFDSVRGPGKVIRADLSTAEVDVPTRFTSFDSDGYTIGFSSTENNASSNSYVSWNWDAGTPPTRTHTQPAYYSSTTLYTTAADVVANATPRSGGDTVSGEYVYIVTNSGGRVREPVFTNNGSLTSPWYMILRTGGSWAQYGSYGTTEPLSFKWRQDFGPTAYTCANNAELHLISDTTTPSTISVTLPTLATTTDDGAVANTDGVIESRVRANPNTGFSIVTYSGINLDTTVGHGLNSTPQLIMVRSRDGNNWVVHHRPYSETNYGTNQPYFHLNTDLAVQATATRFTSTFPTSSVFSIGTSSDVNGNGADYVAYCWSEIPGYSKFGWFTGNYSAEAPFNYTGFKPRWVLIKSAGTQNWIVVDSERLGYNNGNRSLVPNLDVPENYYTNVDEISLYASGFRTGLRNNINEANKAIIWAAFAENPFKYSRAF